MPRYDDEGPGVLGYFLRLILVLVLLGGVGFGAFTLFGDLSRPPLPVSQPVTLPQG